MVLYQMWSIVSRLAKIMIQYKLQISLKKIDFFQKKAILLFYDHKKKKKKHSV